MSCVSIISNNTDQKIPSFYESSRADIIELKSRLFKRLGQQKTQRYLQNLSKLITLKLTKFEFDKLCYHTIGKENIPLHNLLIKSIIGNAFKSFDPKVSNNQTVLTGYSRFSKHKVIDKKVKKIVNNRVSVGPDEKAPHGGFLEVGSVEDGEEVEQIRNNAITSPCIQSRSPIRAPLGIIRNIPSGNFAILGQFGGELPDSHTLFTKLEQKLGEKGIGITEDCVNLLNLSLDLYLNRLIREGINLASARGNMNNTNNMNLVSLRDFRVAFECNRELLGVNWPLWLEKINDYNFGRE